MAFMGIENRDWAIGGACALGGVAAGVGGTLLCQHFFGESKEDIANAAFNRGLKAGRAESNSKNAKAFKEASEKAKEEVASAIED